MKNSDYAPTTKKFSGKTYKLASVHMTEEGTDKAAFLIRKGLFGKLSGPGWARVTKVKKNGKTCWAVYYRAR